MHFCNFCDNMFYIKLSEYDNNKLSYYCRNCGTNNDNIISDNICVSKMNLNNTSQKIDLFINEYTKLDPTLPRTNSIKCPNEKCISNLESDDSGSLKKKQDREVLYIRYDDTNMRYIYVCCVCDYVWKTNFN